MKNRKKLKMAGGGIISGFFNGLFGSGGGVIAVMFLRNILNDEKKAHASATLMILVMSSVSLVFYALYGHVDWQTGFKLVPGGVIGAIFGTILLKNIKNTKLKKLFGLVLAVSGAVMLLR